MQRCAFGFFHVYFLLVPDYIDARADTEGLFISLRQDESVYMLFA